jgi:hypothetical protein
LARRASRAALTGSGGKDGGGSDNPGGGGGASVGSARQEVGGALRAALYGRLEMESTIIPSAELGIKLMVAKSLQDNTKVLLMLFFILGVDQDVINEDHIKLIQLQHEYGVYQVHEMCRSIGESKRHNQILIQPIPGGESSLRDVFRTDLDLMVT